MSNKKINRKNYFIKTFLLIFFLLIIIIYIYLKTINPKLLEISKDYLIKDVYDSLSDVSQDLYELDDFDNLLNIYQNNEGEILYANYDLKNSYMLLSKISKMVESKLDSDKDNIISVPFFLNRTYLLLNYLGPKLNFKVNFLNVSLSNLETKITNYGLNNCLMEIYVKIKVEGNIITPVISEKEEVIYDLLISSSIINGRVPALYGTTLSVESVIFDIPILV